MNYPSARRLKALQLLYVLIGILFVSGLCQTAAYAATSIPFTINTSEAVNVTGTPRIAVDVGGVTRYATYTSGSGTNALTFTYTMVAGDVDLDGVTLSSPIDLNGGTLKDLNGNDATLTFTPPNTSNVKVNYPSLGMDFVADADGRYTLNGTIYNDLSSFLTASGGTFTRASVGTYFDSTGTLQTASSGTPRFDYDPVTHAAKGILIEESRTNLLQRSEEFETGLWYNNSALISQNSTIAPNGTLTADKLGMASAASNQWIGQTYTKPSSTSIQYSFSVYAKAAEKQYLAIAMTAPDYGSYSFVSVNLQTGAATTPTAHGAFSSASSTVQVIGNAWYRIELTAITDTSASVMPILQISDGFATGWTGSTGNIGEGIYIWGAQLEQGAFPTSYIPTTTASVTRVADNLTIPTAGWFNGNTGSIYAANDFNSGVTASSYHTIASINHGTSADEFNLIKNGGSSNAYTLSIPVGGNYGGNATVAGPQNISNYSAINTVATSYSPTQTSITSNGASVISATRTSGLPAAPSNLFLGRSRNNTEYPSGHIKTFKYYPAIASNTQLQLLTQ